MIATLFNLNAIIRAIVYIVVIIPTLLLIFVIALLIQGFNYIFNPNGKNKNDI